MFLFNKTTYRKDIVIALAVKLLALYGLYTLFFSHPQDEHLSQPALIAHYLKLN